MYPSNPRDERRHYPIILHGLKHIGWWRLRRTSLMKTAAMEVWNTPKPAAWSPPLASFSPSALILATRSSNSLPHLAAAVFWWLASIGWFVRCGGRWRRRQKIDEHLGQRGDRTDPGVGWAGRPRPAGPGPFRPWYPPRLLLAWSLIRVHLHVGLWRRFLHG
jgi:hypothetical protein